MLNGHNNKPRRRPLVSWITWSSWNSSSQPTMQWQATETFQWKTNQLGNQNDDIVEIDS